jgi:hypothetical protein
MWEAHKIPVQQLRKKQNKSLFLEVNSSFSNLHLNLDYVAQQKEPLPQWIIPLLLYYEFLTF